MCASKGFASLSFGKYLYGNPGNQDQLKTRFKRYDQQTNSLQFDENDQGNTIIKFRPTCCENQGIEWLIRNDVGLDQAGHNKPPVEVKINPNAFLGRHDDITPATYGDMIDFITKFDSIAKNISLRLLRTFASYKLWNFTYCCNLDVNKLSLGCTSEQLVDLIKRTGMLPIYDRYLKYYDGTLPPVRIYPQYYAPDLSLDIRCDRVNVESLKQEKDIINFEFLCRHISSPDYYERLQGGGLPKRFNHYEDLLSYDTCDKVIDHYLTVIFGKGSWYSLRAAIAQIRQYRFSNEKESQLIGVLEFVSKCWNDMTRVAAICRNDGEFRQTLRCLDGEIGISPVTIPQSWGIDYIKNLFEAYKEKGKERKCG